MERKIYCDYLRVIATFAVVVLHVSGSNWDYTDVNGLEWQAFNFYDCIVRWTVPVFVMISGSLFLNKEITVRKIYSKYVLRMVIAFFTWSIFYALVTPETFENGIIYGLRANLGALASGHYHMWFVLVIIGIYMCIPFYKKIVADSNTMKYFLILAFIFAVLIPWSFQLLNDFVVGNNGLLTKLVGAANTHVSTLCVYMVLGYSFYFVLGYYLDRIELTKKHRMIIYILGVIGFAFTVFATWYLSVKTQQPCSTYFGNLHVNTMIEAVCIHTFFKYREYKNEKFNSFIKILSGYMFGVYLIHPFFVESLSYYLHFNTLSFHAVASVPAISCIVFIIAVLVSAALNHIPIIKKYCV